MKSPATKGKQGMKGIKGNKGTPRASSPKSPQPNTKRGPVKSVSDGYSD